MMNRRSVHIQENDRARAHVCTRKSGCLTAVLTLLVLVNIWLFITLGEVFASLMWSLVLVSLHFLIPSVCRYFGVPQDARRLGLISFLAISCIGLLAVQMYRNAYQFEFGPAADDSHYFQQILSIASAEWPRAFTLFEVLMAGWYRFVEVCFGGPPGNLHLLPMSWGFSALTVVGVYLLSLMVTKKGCPQWLVLVLTVGNVTFLDSVIHLYRDGLCLGLSIFSLLCAIRGRYNVAAMLVVLSGMVRGANGMLAGYGLVIIWLFRRFGHSNAVRMRIIIGSTCVLVLLLMGDVSFGWARFSRTVFQQGAERISVYERSLLRAERFYGDATSDGSDMTQYLYSQGLVGRLLLPVSNLFAPVRLKGIDALHKGTDAVLYRPYYDRISTLIYDVTWFPYNATVLMWLVSGPLIIRGLWIGLSRDIRGFPICLIFVVTLIAVTFVSFQPRHRCAFIVLLPAIVALSVENPQKSRLTLRVLRLVFASGIIGINIVTQVGVTSFL